MNDLERAKQVLITESCTCVLCLGDRLYQSQLRGVQPLLQLLDSGENFSGFSAADKVVGKATAMLYRLLGVRAVWGAVMSRGAIEVLKDAGIKVSWDRQVAHIINRAGTGPCPMEAATAQIRDPQAALTVIRHTLQKLQS